MMRTRGYAAEVTLSDGQRFASLGTVTDPAVGLSLTLAGWHASPATPL
ncbi:hypothetical protein [Streptomyces sp. NPDC002533]